jgi:hypothetical protein
LLAGESVVFSCCFVNSLLLDRRLADEFSACNDKHKIWSKNSAWRSCLIANRAKTAMHLPAIKTLPENPVRDEEGLAMEIVYALV